MTRKPNHPTCHNTVRLYTVRLYTVRLYRDQGSYENRLSVIDIGELRLTVGHRHRQSGGLLQVLPAIRQHDNNTHSLPHKVHTQHVRMYLLVPSLRPQNHLFGLGMTEG